MTIEVSDADEAAELRDLYRWLRADEDVPDEVRLSAEPAPGAMGAGLEVINVVLTHTMGVANLALAYAGWRRARRGRAVFTFTRARDGVRVTVENGSDEAVRGLIAALSETPPHDPPSGEVASGER
ncbi:MAG: effector-associated constant component EACC1 [Actinomycetes bacterium]